MVDPSLIRQMIYFQGRVQGVGFRMTARRIATGYDVTGYVRNLADGRVELVAEGRSPEVGRFVDHIREVMADSIRHCDVHSLPATGEFRGFMIES